MCLDWWEKVKCENKHPIPSGGNIAKDCKVELIFKVIANSLKDLENWYRENMGNFGVTMHATKYMQMLGINGGLVDCKDLIVFLRN